MDVDTAAIARLPQADGSNSVGEAPAGPVKPLVRPIQMGELLRKVPSKRILAGSKASVDAAVLGARQWGVGADGGAEGIIHTHLALERLFFKGDLPRALAVLQVDAENCFGRLENDAIRAEMINEVPELGPAVAWKHRQTSYVEQPGVTPQVKNRGAEQGDTFAPAETGVTLAALGRRARKELHAKQVTGELPRVFSASKADARGEAERHFREVEAREQSWKNQTPLERHMPCAAGVRRAHPGNEIQLGGGVVDVWYLDDGTVVLAPELVVPYLKAYDASTALQGGKRNVTKTIVTLYASAEETNANQNLWQLSRLREVCTVTAPTDAGKSLGIGLGGPAREDPSRAGDA